MQLLLNVCEAWSLTILDDSKFRDGGVEEGRRNYGLGWGGSQLEK